MLIGELFAGIGGLGLGLERAIPGARIAWQVEQNPFCRQILKRHWPDAQQFEDVRWFPWHPPEKREKFADKKPWIQERVKYEVDIIAAGFPCQGASVAGKRLGLSDDRTALWWEVVRIARVLRPRYLVLENVPGLLTVSGGRDFGAVLGSLAEIGYDAEWTTISAAEFGAPHKRERLFIIGTNPNATGGENQRVNNAKREQLRRSTQRVVTETAANTQHKPGKRGRNDRSVLETLGKAEKNKKKRSERLFHSNKKSNSSSQNAAGHDFRYSEAPSPFCGVDDGIPRRMDRLRALGNAVVPQCAEWIGQRIASYQAELEFPW